MSFAPIVLFTFNRPDHTSRTIEALAVNKLAAESDLIVFSDGPRSHDDKKKVDETRKVIASITGFKSVQVNESDKNKGLANSVIDGVSRVVEQYGKVIVLEDDLVVLTVFLTYMNHFLDLYENEDKVISIHGYVYPTKTRMQKPYFIRGADCLGWATWNRGWNLFEPDAIKLYKKISSDKKLAFQFDFEGTYPYLKMLKDQIEGKVDSWAIRWYASAFLKKKLTLYPPVSLLNNIGWDGSGTHSGVTEIYNNNLVGEQELDLFKTPEKIAEDMNMVLAFEDFFRLLKPSIFKRVLNRIRR